MIPAPPRRRRALLLGAAFAAACARGGGESNGSRPPAAAPAPTANVLIYLVDTLRADHLGCYGYRRPVSPAIDALAREATLFDNAVAQSSWTRPTVASVLSGLSPFAHGVRRLEDGLPQSVETLPEMLGAAGWATAGFSPNWHVSTPTGFAQGFDQFEFFPDDASSTSLTRRVLAWLDRRPAGRPWMVYAHALDPHAPYRPPEDLRRALAPAATRPDAGTHDDIVATMRIHRRQRGDWVRELAELYDAEIADTDRAFGQLLDGLRARGMYRDTLIVFLSDHGEGFNEHFLLGHGNSLYGELLDIPLIVKPPGDRPAARVSSLVSQIDVVPTVLATLALPARTTLPGRDLLLPIDDVAARPVVVQLTYAKRLGVALVTAEWKYIEPRSRRFGAAPRLYDRTRDRLDSTDLAAAEPERLAAMAKLLAAELRLPPAPAVPVRPDSEGERALKALGYL